MLNELGHDANRLPVDIIVVDGKFHSAKEVFDSRKVDGKWRELLHELFTRGKSLCSLLAQLFRLH